jgi:hypothetical protein
MADDIRIVRWRYKTAFEAYQRLAAKNIELANGSGQHASVEHLRNEQEALDALITARRELLEALGQTLT